MEEKIIDDNELEKQRIIASIERRIKDEYRKHKQLDWAKIAAHKIYATHFIENKKLTHDKNQQKPV